MDPAALEKTRQALTEATSVSVLTGAGVSAESGVPTFRGAGGLWRNFSATDLATPSAFARDPQLVWEWYDWRRGLIGECRPNDGHRALVTIEERVEHFALITQNIDGLHELAGSGNVIELHGNIWKQRCTGCQEIHEDRSHPLEIPPYCDGCGSLARPHVVWFGESLDPHILDAAAESAAGADVLLVVGTSGLVQPAASLAYVCQRAGGFVAVVNIEQTPHSADMDAMLEGPASQVLAALIA